MSVPSVFTTVLTVPSAAASDDRSWHAAAASALCGMVMFRPARPSVATARTGAGFWAACSDFTVTLEMGVGGKPATLYVLYGESSARSAAVGDALHPPFAKHTVASIWSGLPAARRLWITAEISGRSSSSFA